MKRPSRFAENVTACRRALQSNTIFELIESVARQSSMSKGAIDENCDEIMIVFFYVFWCFSSKLTNVRFFFTDHQVTTLKRSETLAMPAFISSCGGLLGLFLGISVLSVIELIYYATLRLFWSVRKQKSQNIVVPFRHKAIKSIPISINPTNKRDKNVKHWTKHYQRSNVAINIQKKIMKCFFFWDNDEEKVVAYLLRSKWKFPL